MCAQAVSTICSTPPLGRMPWPPTPTAAVAVVTLVAVPLTTQAGVWLEHRVPSTPLLRAHAELGDSMLPWAIGLVAVALALLCRELLSARARSTRTSAGRGEDGPRTARVQMTSRGGPGAATAAPAHAAATRSATGFGGRTLTVALALVASVVAAGSVYTVYEIGDSGSRAAWTGKFSPTPLPRPDRLPHPQGD